MFKQLAFIVVFVFSFQLNADVTKWVDSEGKTHYSNKAPKQHKKFTQKIKFTEYKKSKKTEGVKVPAVDWSKDFKQVGNSVELITHNETSKQSRQRKPRKQQELSITELRAQCDIAREERLAPARAEAIEECIEKNERQTKNVAAYCERFYRDFGDESAGLVYHYPYGRFRHYTRPYNTSRSQRLFHNIPECRRLYRAEDKRSRLNRGYNN